MTSFTTIRLHISHCNLCSIHPDIIDLLDEYENDPLTDLQINNYRNVISNTVSFAHAN